MPDDTTDTPGRHWAWKPGHHNGAKFDAAETRRRARLGFDAVPEGELKLTALRRRQNDELCDEDVGARR